MADTPDLVGVLLVAYPLPKWHMWWLRVDLCENSIAFNQTVTDLIFSYFPLLDNRDVFFKWM